MFLGEAPIHSDDDFSVENVSIEFKEKDKPIKLVRENG